MSEVNITSLVIASDCTFDLQKFKHRLFTELIAVAFLISFPILLWTFGAYLVPCLFRFIFCQWSLTSATAAAFRALHPFFRKCINLCTPPWPRLLAFICGEDSQELSVHEFTSLLVERVTQFHVAQPNSDQPQKNTSEQQTESYIRCSPPAAESLEHLAFHVYARWTGVLGYVRREHLMLETIDTKISSSSTDAKIVLLRYKETYPPWQIGSLFTAFTSVKDANLESGDNHSRIQRDAEESTPLIGAVYEARTLEERESSSFSSCCFAIGTGVYSCIAFLVRLVLSLPGTFLLTAGAVAKREPLLLSQFLEEVRGARVRVLSAAPVAEVRARFAEREGESWCFQPLLNDSQHLVHYLLTGRKAGPLPGDIRVEDSALERGPLEEQLDSESRLSLLTRMARMFEYARAQLSVIAMSYLELLVMLVFLHQFEDPGV